MESVDNNQKPKITIKYYNIENDGIEIGIGSDSQRNEYTDPEMPTIQI